MTAPATAPSPVPYRLVLEDGTERTVLVTDASDDFVGPYFSARPDGWEHAVAASTARGAVVKVAANAPSPGAAHAVGLPVAEILAPWEPSRRELAVAPDKLRARTVAALDGLSLARAEPILAAATRRASDPSVDPFDALLWCVGVLADEVRRVRDVAVRAEEGRGVPPFRVRVDAPAPSRAIADLHNDLVRRAEECDALTPRKIPGDELRAEDVGRLTGKAAAYRHAANLLSAVARLPADASSSTTDPQETPADAR
jgi:hypothetical protein